MSRTMLGLLIVAVPLCASNVTFATQSWDVEISGTSVTGPGELRLQTRTATGFTVCQTTAPCEFNINDPIGSFLSCIPWNFSGACPCTECDYACFGLELDPRDFLRISAVTDFTVFACFCSGLNCTGCDNPSLGFSQITESGLTGNGVTLTALPSPTAVPALPGPGQVALVALILSAATLLLMRRRRKEAH